MYGVMYLVLTQEMKVILSKFLLQYIDILVFFLVKNNPFSGNNEIFPKFTNLHMPLNDFSPKAF